MLKYETNILSLETLDERAPQMLADLASTLCRGVRHIPVRFAWFLDIRDNGTYLEWKQKIAEAMSTIEQYRPAWSLIAQPPLGKAKIYLEVHSIKPEKDEQVSFSEIDGNSVVTVESSASRYLFADIMSPCIDSTIDIQARKEFGIVEGLLNQNGFAITSIYRQWNYVEDITSFDKDGRQHYQMLNDARSELYSKAEWDNGYPAATGIGASAGGVVIWINAGENIESRPIDNPLQVAAHAYSTAQLQDGGLGARTTPKFERARETASPHMMFVSGTAAIRGESSSLSTDAAEQTAITIQNIEALLAQAAKDVQIRTARVYVKNPKDLKAIAQVCEHSFLVSDIMYVEGGICRPELMMEIEAIAY